MGGTCQAKMCSFSLGPEGGGAASHFPEEELEMGWCLSPVTLSSLHPAS